MRKDIYGGLKNAMAHGATLEQAIQSFINAGYNDIEVKEAANSLNPGVLPTLQPQTQPQKQPMATQSTQPTQVAQIQKIPQQYNPSQKPIQQPLQQVQQLRPNPGFQQFQARPLMNQQEKPRKSKGFVTTIILSLILLILVGMLIGVILFRDPIVSFLANLL